MSDPSVLIRQLQSRLGNHFTMTEQTADPPAPGPNQATIFCRDNGAGKTQLCVRFNTGAVQVLSTEP